MRSILVTAGAAGIGRAIAERFLAGGDLVHVVDVADDVVASLPQQILGSCLDVSNESDVEQLIERQHDSHGPVDVLINCAGIQGPTGYIEDISLEDWRRCMAVNLDAMYLMTKAVVPAMKQRASGNIINISSTAGWHGYPLRTPYAASKWAVIGLTKSLAMELGVDGIRCNTICPGSVEGARMDRVIKAEALEKGVQEQEIRDSYTSGSSMRTFISPNDIADMAWFLASDASSKVTGQIMNVDGHLESYGGLNH